MSPLKNIARKLSFLKHVPTWAFLLLFLLSASMSVVSLRHNNQQMVSLREAVYAADKNNTNVNATINNLRNYVYGHMNTNLSSGNNSIKPPIQLKYTYERLLAGAQKNADTDNAQVYTDAQNYCQAQNSTAFSGRTRVPCITEYVTTHGGVQAQTIPESLYKFDFISPAWSPDLAGWSLLVSGILLIALIISFSIDKLVSSRLQQL